MMSQYSSLNRAQLSYDYLHTNSTTHEFLFGGLAELLDNARDAQSTKINIYSVADKSLRGGFMLCFLDDGEGMTPDDAGDIITFGKSTKKSCDSSMIGMYGNGLKSGSMRIGNDLMLFTKKGPAMSCIFLSRTFHEEEQIDEIIVPMPAFDAGTKKPLAKTPKEKEKHNIEMSLILKYSPFKTEAAFFREFDKIDGTRGTLVVIYNMKLLDSGESELDVRSDPHDIIVANPESGDFDSDEGPRLMPERKSFRAYASVLYVDPRMRIYIQGKKVQTKRLASCLFKPRLYKYSSSRFKTRSENETKKAKDEALVTDNRAKEAESKARNLENKIGAGGTREQRADLRKLQTIAAELRKIAQIKKQIADRKVRSLKDPKTLSLIFGVNLDSRNQDGVFVYNCSRLIKMYQKVGPQADGGVFCSGVVGIVDVPYLVLEPTHNKQDFADAKEYRHLQRAMGEHMVQYWKDCGIAQQGVTKFWESFGYISSNWRDLPSEDMKFFRKRAMTVQSSLQCDLCLKWRILPYSSNTVGKPFPDDWVCSMNPDSSHNRCSSAEQKMNIPEGVLKKEHRSKEQKEKDLEEDIRKKQDALDRMIKSKPLLPVKRPRTHSTRPPISKVMKRVSRQVRDTESDDSEDDEEDEEEEEEEQKHHRRNKQTSKRSIRQDSDTIPTKRPATASVVDSQQQNTEVTSISQSSSVGVKVEAKINNQWNPGVVVETNNSNKRWKVKFDKLPHDKHDKWYEKGSSQIRIITPPTSTNNTTTTTTTTTSTKSVAAESSTTAAEETPTSSTVTANNPLEDIANGYRTCLRYFLPPHWNMDKESVSTLTVQELAQFPLDDFFDHYEKGLRKLVSSFQVDAQSRQQEAEQARTKLTALRRMIAKLLKSINEEFDIDPECDTEEVDDLLGLCVRQAAQQTTE